MSSINQRIFRLCAKVLKHIAPILGLKYELRGGEHLAKKESFVVVLNHQSSIDAIGKSRCTALSSYDFNY